MPHRVHQANKTKIFDDNVLRVHLILQRLHPFSISASAGLRTTLTSLKTMWLAVRPFKRRSALRWIGILRTKISLNFVGLFFFCQTVKKGSVLMRIGIFGNGNLDWKSLNYQYYQILRTIVLMSRYTLIFVMIDSEFYFLTHLWSKLSPEQVTSGYTTEEDCKKWPREVLFALSFLFFISWSHFSIFISPCFCFFSLSIQSLPITQVCTISKETKRKFNPVTKCEKVREVPCQALETGTETFKRNETK